MRNLLSKREVEVLGLAAEGNADKQIAAALVVSVWTVRAHMRHIIKKLGVSGRTQAAVKAWALGLIE